MSHRISRQEARARIESALYYAAEYGGADGEHHKMWVIDQVVRALTGCDLVTKTATGANGQSYNYQTQGECTEYWAFRGKARSWDEGVAP